MRGDGKTKGADAARSKSAEQPAVDGEQAEKAEAEDQPLNRAERRARGKKLARQQPDGQGHGKVSGGKGPVQAPRMWANRRSG